MDRSRLMQVWINLLLNAQDAMQGGGRIELSARQDETAISISILDDGDGIDNLADNCPTTANADQIDTDRDGIGDACEPDTDGDSVIDDTDNCRTIPNPAQSDIDGDRIGDVCDSDIDGDGLFNDIDAHPSEFSNIFRDIPLGGNTFGRIIDRGDSVLTIVNPDSS